jgi:hypothetical protein
MSQFTEKVYQTISMCIQRLASVSVMYCRLELESPLFYYKYCSINTVLIIQKVQLAVVGLTSEHMYTHRNHEQYVLGTSYFLLRLPKILYKYVCLCACVRE